MNSRKYIQKYILIIFLPVALDGGVRGSILNRVVGTYYWDGRGAVSAIEKFVLLPQGAAGIDAPCG